MRDRVCQALGGDVTVGSVQFGANKLPPFQQCGHAGGTAAGKRIEYDTTWRAHPHDGAHEFGRLAGNVVLVFLADRLDVIARQIADFHTRWHVTFATPHRVFRAVTEATGTARASCRFQPWHDATPGRTGGLHGIGGAGKLAPVGEKHHGCAWLGHAQALGQPQRDPQRPASLVTVVTAERAVLALGTGLYVFLGGGQLALRHMQAAGAVRRIGDDCVHGRIGKGTQEGKGFALMNLKR